MNIFFVVCDIGWSDDKGVVGVVGDDFIEVVCGECLVVVGEYFLWCMWWCGFYCVFL